MQAEFQSEYPLLYTVSGFQYCDLLLAGPERAAWRQVQESAARNQEPEWTNACRAVSERARQTLKLAERNRLDILSAALDHLTLGCATLYLAILENSDFRLMIADLFHIDAAVADLRRAASQDHIPRGILTRAWLRFLSGAHTGTESAQEDLDEAWEIAERGPMRLHMADIHLYRARLFHAVKPYPWEKFADGSEGRGPKDDLADARKLIERCGYWRRKEELEDAEEAARNWD
jgi:hypothetical protein